VLGIKMISLTNFFFDRHQQNTKGLRSQNQPLSPHIIVTLLQDHGL
jgi:hypothetical protein